MKSDLHTELFAFKRIDRQTLDTMFHTHSSEQSRFGLTKVKKESTTAFQRCLGRT